MNKITKALRRISGELLDRYKPIFYNANNDNDKNNIFKNIEHNKIFLTLTKYLKDLKDLKNKNFYISSNSGIFIDNIRDKINTDNDLTYEKKNELIQLLNHINNILIINKYDYNKKNDVDLATEVFEHNDNIDTKNKETIKEKKIIEKYIDKFRDNLDIGNSNKDNSTLFGYNYNIITYNYISNNVREKSNKIFQFVISLISTWILFGKTIASPFFLSKVSDNINDYKNIIQDNNNTLWKIISMGLNLSYFDNVNIKNIKEDNTNINYSYSFSGLVSILSFFNINILYKILNFILYFYLLSFYNSSVFGMVLNPLFYNIITMIFIIILIFINIKRIKEGNTLFPFNYINKFFKIICVICIILIIIGLIIHYYNKK